MLLSKTSSRKASLFSTLAAGLLPGRSRLVKPTHNPRSTVWMLLVCFPRT
ncbi:hypothetical protein A0J61_09645 [Choanephora cucurbitarum]|uniref:Uncharacterized protein n=1 Tax=Choanephora cucurbitarum TaxID=101091 RepID=A0A1C7MZP5_9FUNG|nr:hypothetical protein A0J61_09645 [Choanephora cucurbitarum]